MEDAEQALADEVDSVLMQDGEQQAILTRS
jgi:hypothetical protein